MKWKITYGMCDGTGPYIKYSKPNITISEAIRECGVAESLILFVESDYSYLDPIKPPTITFPANAKDGDLFQSKIDLGPGTNGWRCISSLCNGENPFLYEFGKDREIKPPKIKKSFSDWKTVKYPRMIINDRERAFIEWIEETR